nr:hypothetical protein [Tanacetum cinerariifolium]
GPSAPGRGRCWFARRPPRAGRLPPPATAGPRSWWAARGPAGRRAGLAPPAPPAFRGWWLRRAAGPKRLAARRAAAAPRQLRQWPASRAAPPSWAWDEPAPAGRGPAALPTARPAAN